MNFRSLSLLGTCAALAVLSSCGSGNGGPGPSGLDAPTLGSVFGNWTVDGATIQVVADTGAPHLVRDGNTLRIDPEGVDVLLDSSIRDGSVFRRWSGATGSELLASAAGAQFELALTLDFSIPPRQPALTDFRVVTCMGEVRSGELHVRYVATSYVGRVESERDELQFACRPGARVRPEMTGTWEVTALEVIADTGAAHRLETADLLVVADGAVVQLFSDSWVAREYRDVAAARTPDSAPSFADALRFGSAAGTGRIEGEIGIVGGGRGVVFPGGVPPRLNVWFEFVRAGDVASGKIHLERWQGGFINSEVDELAVTMRLRR